jgi:hypothetical protein
MSIVMWFDDHGPPHFHAHGGGMFARVTIADAAIVGQLAPRWRRRLEAWTRRNRRELLDNWSRLRRAESIVPIS